MCPYFEDDNNPKKPRPVEEAKKPPGWMERGEARKDHDRDHHRHVLISC